MKKALSLFLATLLVLSTMSCLSVVSFGADADGNDTYTVAMEIVSGDTVVGYIPDSSDIDWYKFESDKDYFIIDFSPEDKADKNSEWNVRIYDSNMNILEELLYKNSFSTSKYAYTGTIYVEVKPYNNACYKTDYTLKVNTYDDEFREDEYNNELSVANQINTNATYVGEINDSSDIDCYKFESDKDYFTIDFSPESKEDKNSQWNVKIYNSSKEKIGEYSYKNSFSTSKYAYMGTIYVEVKPHNNACYKTEYALKANSVDNGDWEKENNNESTKANTIEQDTIYKGTLVKASDIDWFKFTSTSEAFRVKLNVDLNESSSDDIGGGWKISVKPVDSSVSLEEVKEGEAGTFATRTLPYEKGKEYFVKVEKNTSEVPVDVVYNLVVEDASKGYKWENEDGGNDIDSATDVEIGETVWGNIHNSSDDDYFRITLPAQGKLKVDFGRTVNSKETGDGWQISILNGVTSESDPIDFGNSAKASYTFIDTEKGTDLKSGTYYIRINKSAGYGDAPDSKIDYNLTFTYTMTVPKLSSVSNASNGVSLKWAKVEDCTGYEIYRKAGSGSWKKLATVKGESKVSYTDKSAKTGTKYSYKVRAYDGSEKSAFSSSKTITFLSAPKAKSISTAKAGVTFTWAKVSGASGYEVYRATGSGSYKKLVTVKKGSTVKFVDKSAKKGKTYKYKVRAYKGDSKSAFSSVKKIKDKY